MKTLKEEGITKEFLKSFDIKYSFSPAQLRPEEEPVVLIACSTGFWIMLEPGKYLKDEKNQLIVVLEKEAKIGRARYLLNFKNEIALQEKNDYEDRVQREIGKLKKEVDYKLGRLLVKINNILIWAGKKKQRALRAFWFQ